MPRKKKDQTAPIPTGGKVINYYEVMPKDLILKADNPNKHLHDINLPFRMCVSAPSGSGKTNFIVNLIAMFCAGNGTFEDITIITRNADEPLYKYLTKQSEQIQVKEGLHNIPTLDKMNKETNHLVCFDDLVLAKDQSAIINYYIRARKLNCSVIYLSQSFFDIPSIIRKNCSYMVFLKIGGLREVKTILRDFALNCSKEQLINMYEYATNEKLSPFLLDLEADRIGKFRKGFKEVLDPSGFGEEEDKNKK